MPPDPACSDLALEARNALTVVQGRLQLLQRRTDNGPIDDPRIRGDIETSLERIRRVNDLISALEAAAERASAAGRG
jgi:hypothetical protein